MSDFNMPDITPVQFVGIATGLVNTLVAFGIDLSARQQAVLLSDAGIVAALLFGDALIRHGRSRVLQHPPKPDVSSDVSA